MLSSRHRMIQSAATIGAGGVLLLGLSAAPAAASTTNCTGNAGSTDNSGSVCVHVNGSKLHVSSVTLEKKSNHGSWTDQPYIKAGKWHWKGKKRHGARVATVKVTKKVKKSFANNTTLCGWWVHHPGTKACAKIHK